MVEDHTKGTKMMTIVRRDIEPEVVDLYKKTRIDLSALPEIMTAEELAMGIRTSVGALSQDRYLRRGIPYLKLGRRIRYARAEVARYLLDHHVAA